MFGEVGAQAQVRHGVDIRIGDIGAVVEAAAAADPGAEHVAFQPDHDRAVLPIVAAGDTAKHAARFNCGARLREVEIAGCPSKRSANPPPGEEILCCGRRLIEKRRRPGIDDVGTENGARDPAPAANAAAKTKAWSHRVRKTDSLTIGGSIRYRIGAESRRGQALTVPGYGSTLTKR